MPQQSSHKHPSVEEICAFLTKIGESNESTEYSTDQEYIITAIIELAKLKGRKAIVDDFATPYVHPMITIQKWVEELKLIADEALNDSTYGDRHSLFNKKIVEMNGYDVTRLINYLREDGLIT